jgi:transcriptional regulator
MLTTREQEVLRLRAQGLTQQEVASRMKISQAAVSGFEQNARRKIIDANETLALASRISPGLMPETTPNRSG